MSALAVARRRRSLLLLLLSVVVVGGFLTGTVKGSRMRTTKTKAYSWTAAASSLFRRRPSRVTTTSTITTAAAAAAAAAFLPNHRHRVATTTARTNHPLTIHEKKTRRDGRGARARLVFHHHMSNAGMKLGPSSSFATTAAALRFSSSSSSASRGIRRTVRSSPPALYSLPSSSSSQGSTISEESSSVTEQQRAKKDDDDDDDDGDDSSYCSKQQHDDRNKRPLDNDDEPDSKNEPKKRMKKDEDDDDLTATTNISKISSTATSVLQEESTTTTTTTTTLSPSNSSSSSSSWRKNWQRRAGGMLASLGFVASSTRQVVAAWMWTDDDDSSWKEQRRQWNTTIDALQQFLESSGIQLELMSQLLNVRLLDNVLILSRVERALWKERDRRDHAASSSSSSVAMKIPTTTTTVALRYMKYATAVYGEAMIRAAEMDVLGRFDTRSLSYELGAEEEMPPTVGKRISEHCSIPEEDIVLLDVDYDGNSNHLRHFVAVDHEQQKVVLAIRGTFSLSEIIVDAAGFSRPFCGAEAHSEMATMAERLWEVAGPTILQLLEDHPTYEFVITGHSLGAGVASLLNILCHHDNLVPGRTVHCLTFAAPPTFAPLDHVPEAVQRCINYIHERDVVPFLSVDAIRHLFNCIKAIEEEELSWTQRIKLITGYTPPTEHLMNVVRIANQNRLAPKPGAPILYVPAAANVWMRETQEPTSDGRYNVKVCDSVALSRLGIFVDRKMLEDHFPSRYEHALHHLDD